MSCIDAFRSALSTAGLGFSGEILTDTAKPVRFTPDDAKGKCNGWYKLHTDGRPSAAFGDWSTGFSTTWKLDGYHPAPTQAERDEWAKKKERRLASELARQAKQALHAGKLWSLAKPAADIHPYLVRKGIGPQSLRVGGWTIWHNKLPDLVKGCLYVPMYFDRKLVNLQAIFPAKHPALERDRSFLPGARVDGCYSHLGDWSGERAIVICEGWATGVSIHLASGLPVCVAFSANNLLPVAQSLRRAYPARAIVIGGDNDRFKTWPDGRPRNTGADLGAAAAKAIGGRLVLPVFASDDGKPTDFNDLHLIQGLAAVAEQLITTPKD